MLNHQNAEHSVIGTLLIDDRCIPMIRSVLLSADAFSSTKCRLAYDTICQLDDQHKPVDPITVGHASGLDIQFLQECMEIAPHCNSAAEYATIVKENAMRRQLRNIGDKLQLEALSPDTNTYQIVADARNAMDLVVNELGVTTIRSPDESLSNFLKFRDDVKNGKVPVIKTGFSSLDSMIGGLAPGNLYIIAARPGVGKSAFGIALADMLAKSKKVLYVSLEMSENEINARRISAFSALPCTYARLLYGSTSATEDQAIATVCASLSERQMYLSEASHLTVAELGIQAQNINADIVFVDYLGLLAGSNKKATEYERITQISKDLKQLAKQQRRVVIALCQLNRESTGIGADKRPKLSQLRSSGAIEQDADGVLLLHRPEYDQADKQRNPTTFQQFYVDVAKNRHGRTGVIELAWQAPVNRFEDRGGKQIDKSWI